MKKLFIIAVVFAFVAGCSNQKKVEVKAPDSVSVVKPIVNDAAKTIDTAAKKDSVKTAKTVKTK